MEHDATLPPHRAGPDSYVTAHLLKRLIESGTSVDDMVRWSKGAALLPRVTFGKHKGAKWSELPTDYLEWIWFKSDMGRDEKANAKHHLRERGILR
jgi:exodeoxyribonuclease X